MKKAVCGYKDIQGFVSTTTLSFDRVYDEVKLNKVDIMQFFSGPYSPNFAWYILWISKKIEFYFKWISHTKNKTKCS